MTLSHRKKLLSIALLAFLLCCAFFPAASLAAEEKALTILFTGSVRGTIEPCHS